MNSNWTSFAELYLDNSLFADAANQTIGKPIVGPDMQEIFFNRRSVTKRLTPKGHQVLDDLIARIQKHTGLTVKAEWDIHCGCAMCPCSPGYRLKARMVKGYGFGREQFRFSIWTNSNGEIRNMRAPKEWAWNSYGAAYQAIKSLCYPLPVKVPGKSFGPDRGLSWEELGLVSSQLKTHI